MLARIFKAIKRAREPAHIRLAREVAEIVSGATKLTFSYVDLKYNDLPSYISTKLLGYLYGSSMVICASWQIKDTGVPVGAALFAIELIFPGRSGFFIKLLTDDVFKSPPFLEGREAGQKDCERLLFARAVGQVALLGLLAKDFKAYCNHVEAADMADKLQRLS